MSDLTTGPASEATRERVARAIYMAHWRAGLLRWEDVHQMVRDWVLAQADAVIAELASIE